MFSQLKANRLFFIVILGFSVITTIGLVIGLSVYYKYFLNKSTQNNLKSISETESLANLKIAYKSPKGDAMVYDFSQDKEIDLNIKGVTRFLWSKDGKLAVIVQGEYGGNESSGGFRIPSVHATTEGFHYSLYLIDFTNLTTPKLLLPELFGEAYWATDSSGIYYTENYYFNYTTNTKSKVLIGDPVTFNTTYYKFVSLDGKMKDIIPNEFDDVKQSNLALVSPDGTYIINYKDSNYFAVQNKNNQLVENLVKPGDYYKSTKDAKWSPDGTKIAFTYTVDKLATTDNIFNVISTRDIITRSFKEIVTNKPMADVLEYDWIDNDKLIVEQFSRVPVPGFYQGTIGILNLRDGSYKVIVPNVIINLALGNDIQVTPNNQLFAYIINPLKDGRVLSRGSGTEQIIISDLSGKELKKLSGYDMTWSPSEAARESYETSLPSPTFTRGLSEEEEVKALVTHFYKYFQDRDPSGILLMFTQASNESEKKDYSLLMGLDIDSSGKSPRLFNNVSTNVKIISWKIAKQGIPNGKEIIQKVEDRYYVTVEEITKAWCNAGDCAGTYDFEKTGYSVFEIVKINSKWMIDKYYRQQSGTPGQPEPAKYEGFGM
jgi:hypothetical protein